jgi:hypothetical protein
VLEKAVRWVIILIVIVFDPLALTLLLAATKTLEWERGINIMIPARRPYYEPDDGPLTNEQLDQLRARAKNDLPTGKVVSREALLDPEVTEFFDRAKEKAKSVDAGTYEPPEEQPVKKQSILSSLDNMWSRAKKIVTRDSESEHAPLEVATVTKGEETPVDPFMEDLVMAKEPVIEQHHEPDEDDITDPLEKEAQRRWKLDHPTDTIKHWRKLHANGHIDELPWHNPDYYPELRPELGLQPDNLPDGKLGEVKGFGTAFPTNANKGDMFLRVDQLPSLLYKFNGSQWIEVDKNQSDQHAYNNAYIDHLIEKISTGEYDPDLLSDAERDSIEHRLKQTSNLT